MASREEDEDSLDLSEWDDVLCAEPEKSVTKPGQRHGKDGLDDEENDDGWNDVIAIEVLENYCTNLMKQMETFRKQNVLCDAMIVVDDMNMPVHKNVLSAMSPFFKNIFSRITNPEDNKITLRNLTGQIMDDILHFVYTGEACIHDGNVRQLVAVSNFLQLHGLKEMAIRYLEKKLSPGSAVEILILADKHNCDSLLKSAEKLICDNFVVVSKTDGFRKLSLEVLLEFVKSEDIRVMKEEEVFEAVIAWTKSDFGDRREKLNRLPDLLAEVRMPLVSPSYLSDVIEKEELVRQNPSCMQIVQEGKNYHSPYGDRGLIDNRLTRPRKFMGVVLGIVAAGGWQNDAASKDVYAYITSNFKWFPLCPLPSPRYGHAVVSCDGFIYVIGGRNDSTKLCKTVLRFDPTENRWQYMSPLPIEAASIGACTFQGQLYVVGGLTALGSSNLVLRFSARNNIWQPISNLNIPRGALSLVSDDKCIYAIGGMKKTGASVNASWEHLDTMEVYNRESNKWNFGSPLLSPRAHSAAVCINQRIYLTGGQSKLLGISKGMDVYDTMTREWTSIPYLGIPRSMSGISVCENTLFVVGGITKEGECVNTAESYDTSKNRWQKIPSLPHSASSLNCCTIQLRLAVLQGMTTSLSE